ncbi:hypothetical protein EJ08DRAFT_712476 [Tothia fuscella]|uniref:Uncharacterized protein n=1 Tax=Tothia fuscella TaxID=1048955 RepID=A0A9P4NV23_9PEZI|nr:hypothetical protein EJ08DRAFT_712476 [Tothia fuscella]
MAAQAKYIGPSDNAPQQPITPGVSYRGPSMKWLMANHKFASQIIATYPMRPADILDDAELVLLRNYVEDPSRRKQILQERGLWSEDPVEREKLCGGVGSLTCWVIGREVFDGGELDMLREWFGGVGMRGNLEGVVARGREEMRGWWE